MSAHDALAILIAAVFVATNLLGAWFTLKRNNITFRAPPTGRSFSAPRWSLAETLEDHFLRPIFLWLAAPPDAVMGFTESQEGELDGRQLVYIATRTVALILAISVLVFSVHLLLSLFS